MRLIATAWRAVTRWYVLAAASIAIGAVVGAVLFFSVLGGRPQIGFIDIPFMIITENSAVFVGDMLDFARRDDSIKGVVVRLTSPGGGASASEGLFLKMRQLRAVKPVVVAVEDIAASGGYMMAVASNHLFVKPSSTVGSVGARFRLFPAPPPNEIDIGTGPSKLTGGTDRTFLRELEQIKESFLQMVLAERGDKLKVTPEEIVEARTYPGMEGVRLGLVDEIGSDAEAIALAAELAGISRYDLFDVNAEVLRLQIEKLDHIFGEDTASDADRPPGIESLKRLFPPLGDDGTPGGVPPDFPIKVALPRFYYLYVAPTE